MTDLIAMTGASGFLGRHVHARLVADGRAVRRIGRQEAELVVDLLREGPRWEAIDAPATLLHCAGIMTADAQTVTDSARMSVNLLAALPASVTQIILVSSAYVYAPSSANVGEDEPPRPVDVYGHAKVMVEELFRGFAQGTGRALVVLRPCAIYGPGDPHQKAVTRFVAGARAGQRPTLHGPTAFARDYIHVGDAARGVCAAVLCGRDRPSGEAAVYNICTGSAWSAAEVAKMIGDIKPELAQSADMPPAEPLGYRFDPSRAARELDFRAEIDLRSALTTLLGDASS